MKRYIYLFFMGVCLIANSQDHYSTKISFSTNTGWCKLATFDLEGNGIHNSVIVNAKINYVRTNERGYSATAQLILREGASQVGAWNYSITGTEIGDYIKFKKINDTTYELFGMSTNRYGHISVELSVTKEAPLIVDLPTSLVHVADPDIYQDVPEYGKTSFVEGNVGIGTTNPDSKLTVKGNIHAQEVKLDLNGSVAPDYVFKEGYDLKILEEVEDHIQKEGHLPNIPSAKKMEEEGIDLKAMNLKLLEKVEELTLYAIQQEKRVDTLESKNRELTDAVSKLMETHEK
ncbi:tail fiber protein [Galbibacter sp. EGI 63066]|uniref:tail fiber protein n=1 Tax=Galbibacter sp. EGI 63066 TaxID=2993559 RepID=UPI002248DFEC|nr:tail fiber protein [Galbibacter sp. EGI 63066]MCX2680344.1 tail fiber protein [Galbibacter sp. EGI 63066]